MLKQEQLYIKGMTCINCQNRIEDIIDSWERNWSARTVEIPLRWIW